MTDSFDTGGSERQFAALASSLDPALFNVHVGCLQKRGGFLQGLERAVEFSPGGNLYGLHSLRARLRLARYLKQSRTLIAHAFDFYTNLMLIPAARLARVPVVIGSQRQLGDLLSPAKFRSQLAVFRWCDRVICNSRAAASRLIDCGISADRVVVIGNGLADSAFARTPPALPRRPELLRVGMIARMNAQSKNHGSFLRAAACLRGRFPNIEFVLVGDGPLRPELERQADDLGIRDQVRFLGDRRDIPAILASIDVSVLPSVSESLSNVILESMAAGVPVVASRIGGNVELIESNRGILVEPDDDTRLASAVEILLGNSDRRAEIGQNAKKFVQSNFTIAHMQERHEELYCQLLAQKVPRLQRSYGFPRPRDSRVVPLRVVIVAASSRYVGGQSVQAELLVSKWHDDSEVEARLIPIDPPLPRGLKWAEHIPFFRTLLREPIYLANLWRGLDHADVAHVFSASYWSFLISPAPAWLIGRLKRKPTLLHYHSGEAQDHLRRSRSARSVLAKVDRLVVPSGYLVDVFREFGLAAHAVPNIADVERFSFRVRNPLRPHLVCTRGFHRYYRVDLVVRAFAEVRREFPQASLDLVGQGPVESEIRRLVADLGIEGVNFVGVASREQIAQFYDSADIFINASCLDNMPVSILEAFASGTPVVSSTPEGITYLIEHERTGLLSEVGDARALAHNVLRLLRDSELSSRIAINAYEQCRQYRWAEVREQWIDVYDSLTQGRVRSKRGLISVA
jgi:glycosyltransferase involved in cell wall biosynthesis